MSFTPAEVRFFIDNQQRISAISSEVSLTKETIFADRAMLDAQFGPYARAVSALLAAQRKMVGKFPATWIADMDAVEQATPLPVARYRAQRLARSGAAGVHDVTCSVGTEGAPLIAAGVRWIGSDLDYSRVLMARANLGESACLLQADALTPTSNAEVIVADPARRVDGRRITDPAQLRPALPALLDAYRGRELAVKCAPGIDYSQWHGLVSVVSVAGGVKEACLYTPGLGGIGREAVVFRGDVVEPEVVHSADPDEVAVAAPGKWIIEPDGAIVRAGLVRQWAYRHGLWMLDPHIAFLTGDVLPDSTSGFELCETVGLKQLRKCLQGYGAGAVEILVRGVDIDPDVLRKKLKLRGKRQMAVVIARVGDGAVAYVCRARSRVAQA